MLEDYLTKHTDEPSEILKEIEKKTLRYTTRPQMISGTYQGRFLAAISKMIRPSKVLEIGTFTGYSAICLAEGLANGGVLHTIEKDKNLQVTITENLNLAGLTNSAMLHIGDAIDVLQSMDSDFDLIFIDANKKKYLDYYKIALTMLKPGGYIIVDNVLWKNTVLSDNALEDNYTKYMKNFNSYVKNDPSVEKIIVPVRDGLFLIRKK